MRAAGVIGLERMPARLREALADSASNLVATANELDLLVAHGGDATRAEIDRRAGEGSRARQELATSVAHAFRVGPDGVRLLGIVEAVSELVEALDDIAWAWGRRDVPEAVALVTRDLARALARAVVVLDDADACDAHLQRASELAAEARAVVRRACADLLASGAPSSAVAALPVLDRVEAALAAARRLHRAVQRYALA